MPADLPECLRNMMIFLGLVSAGCYRGAILMGSIRSRNLAILEEFFPSAVENIVLRLQNIVDEGGGHT